MVDHPAPTTAPVLTVGTTSVCRVCGAEAAHIMDGPLLDQRVAYFECAKCGYVQTEQPHWLDQAYESAINLSDTGIMSRNLFNRNVVINSLFLLGDRNGRVLDYAGGYGILVRLLRDVGVSARWFDPYCENRLASGFEYDPAQKISLLTAFEAFEHFVDPAEELAKMFEISPNVLISTELIADPTPAHDAWWYYGQEHGQHIGFFRTRTLQRLADRFGKHLSSDGQNYHLFSEKPISSFAFRKAVRFSGLTAVVLKRFYTSKVHSDHELIKKKQLS